MPLTRSEQMARVTGKNTSPERLLRAALWREGLRYRLHARTPVGRPDIVFLSKRVAIFIDGCFWHGCPLHYSRPRSREEFWAEKLAANVERDRRQTLALERAGWSVMRVWEHEVFGTLGAVVQRVCGAVRGDGTAHEPDWRVYRVTPAPADGPGWERRDLCSLRDSRVTRSEVGARRTGSDKKR